MLPPSAVRCLRRLSRHSMLVLRAIMDRVSLHLVGQKWTLSLGRGMRAWRQGAAAAVDEDGVLTAIAGMSVSETPVNDPGRLFAHPLSHPSDGVVAIGALCGVLFNPSSRIRAGKRGFCDFSDSQVIDLERVRPSVLAENGCSEDLPDSQARDGADRFGRIMFLRRTERKKNGKAHSYWNVVENKRLDDGRVVQRHVLYLGEINSSQAAAWRKAIEVFDEDAGRSRTLALFPEDRCEAIA